MEKQGSEFERAPGRGDKSNERTEGVRCGGVSRRFVGRGRQAWTARAFGGFNEALRAEFRYRQIRPNSQLKIERIAKHPKVTCPGNFGGILSHIIAVLK